MARKKLRSDIVPGKASALMIFDAIASASHLSQRELAIEVGLDANHANLLSMAKFGTCGLPLGKVKRFCDAVGKPELAASLAENVLKDFQLSTYEALSETGALSDKSERDVLEPFRKAKRSGRKFSKAELQSISKAIEVEIENLA